MFVNRPFVERRGQNLVKPWNESVDLQRRAVQENRVCTLELLEEAYPYAKDRIADDAHPSAPNDIKLSGERSESAAARCYAPLFGSFPRDGGAGGGGADHGCRQPSQTTAAGTLKVKHRGQDQDSPGALRSAPRTNRT